MPAFTNVNSTGIKSLIPQSAVVGDAGLAIDQNMVTIATLIASLQTAVAAANTAITAANAAIAALGTPTTISGSIAESQVTGLVGHLAAKLSTSGGTIAGTLSVENITLLGTGGSTGIYDAVLGLPFYTSDSTAIGLLNGSLSVSLSTGIFGFGGNPVALNDGSGTGGGEFYCDGATVHNLNTMKGANGTLYLDAFGNPTASIGGTAGNIAANGFYVCRGSAGATGTFTDPNGNTITVTGGIITALS